MKYLMLIGRVFFALIFILAAPGHFSKQYAIYAASAGVPFASLAVPLSGIIALLGGLSIAMGYKTKWGAWLIILFLIPVTLMMHNFWAINDKMMAQTQYVMFMKNISMLGGAIFMAYFGSGPLSIDEILEAKSNKK